MIIRQPLGISLTTALRSIAGVPYAHFLTAGQAATHAWGGQWDIIAAAPVETLTLDQSQIYENGAFLALADGDNFFQLLREKVEKRAISVAAENHEDYPPFVSGVLGHVGYEAGALLEPSLSSLMVDKAAISFGFYDAVAAWHRTRDEAYVFAKSEEYAENLRTVLRKNTGVPEQLSETKAGNVSTSKSRHSYIEMVKACKEKILDGDIFQANLARRLRSECALMRDADHSLLTGFKKWMAKSASPFSACMQYKDVGYLSNSPERFFSITNMSDGTRRVLAEPIKGTRKRSRDLGEDKAVAAELLANDKERAENIMIADLVRNDLSKICRDHSINEEQICELESFAHVHHLVSRISGTLKPGLTALDVLMATFPCGSITGAPKIRAMEIINELENEARGIYCGTIGFMDDRGNADFSVTIRTIEAKKEGRTLSLSYGAGGGITILSDPQEEYAETSAKAETFHSFLEAFGQGKD